jgi:flagellar assembly protein FliH
VVEKVIQSQISGQYAIDKYKYKSFSEEELVEPPKHTHIQKHVLKDFDSEPKVHVKQHEEPKHHEEPPREDPVLKSQVESLLTKIDELSSSLVKMEMQMEKQEQDFSNRLEEDKKRAYDDGFNAAKAQMQSDFAAKIEANDAMLTSSVKKLEESADGFGKKMGELEESLAKTAVSIAEQVIKKEVSENSSKIAVALTSELLSKLKGASRIKIKANKEDVERIRASLSQDSKITIEEDDAIQKGGVIVLSDIGNLDGNINARFLKVKEDLLGDNG